MLAKVLAVVVPILFLSILAFSLYRSWDEVSRYDWRFNYLYLIPSSFFLSLSFVVNGSVWHWMMRNLGQFSDIRKNFKFYFYSVVARHIPSILGSAVSRLYFYQKDGVPKAAVLAISALEIVASTLGGLVSFLLLWPFNPYGFPVVWTVALSVISFLLLIICLRPSFVTWMTNWFLIKLKRDKIALKTDSRDMLYWVMGYVISSFGIGLVIYFLIMTIHPLTSSYLFIVLSIVITTNLVNLIKLFLPAGLGLSELALSVLLNQLIPLPMAIAMSIAVFYRFWFVLHEVLWGLVLSRL